MVQILGNNDMAQTLLHEDLQCTLEEQAVMARPETDDNAHGFPLTRERDHLHNLCRLMSFLPILLTKVLGKLEKDRANSVGESSCPVSPHSFRHL